MLGCGRDGGVSGAGNADWKVSDELAEVLLVAVGVPVPAMAVQSSGGGDAGLAGRGGRSSGRMSAATFASSLAERIACCFASGRSSSVS